MKLSIYKLFSVGCVFLLLGISNYSLAQTESKDPAFRPRSDAGAIRDTQAFREHLNKLKDSRGPINPLGDYLQRNSESLQNERDHDTESEQNPVLKRSPDGYRSSESPPEPKRPKGITLLPGPKFTIIQQASPSQASYAALDAFRPARFVSDLEATSRPTLQAPVSFASADIPVIGNSVPIAAYYQLGPALPGGNGGIPSSSPILPNAVPLTNTAPTFAPPPTTFAPPTTYSPPPTTYSPPPTTYVSPPSYTAPSTPQGFSQVNPPPMISSPIGGLGVPGAIPVNPGTTFVAPTPFYPSSPIGGGVPMASPNDIMPRYPPRSTTINGPPFVSAAPCQFDASYMVSSSVYRQSLDSCGPAQGNPRPYASSTDDMRLGASPFSYVPPTYMAPRYRNPPYPTLIGFGQTLNNSYASRGIIGQPKLYIDGQPVRNFVRYLTP